MRDAAVASLRALIEVAERLRAPGGCPWDREQTHSSLRPYLLEETYEVLEAIDGGGAATLREELGDVLLQVLMHSAIAAEEGRFDIGDVAETTMTKMIHRHPHVFGDTAVGGAAEVVVAWERLKRAEKNERLSVLDGIPRALPALAYAQGVQKRPARLGFDETPLATDAAAALREALERLEAVAATTSPPPRGQDWTIIETEIRHQPASAGAAEVDAPAWAGTGGQDAVTAAPLQDAMGELLFAAVALARRLRVNPEDALRARANRFTQRFRALETRARADGADLHDIDGAEWTRRWGESAPAAPD